MQSVSLANVMPLDQEIKIALVCLLSWHGMQKEQKSQIKKKYLLYMYLEDMASVKVILS